jgi:PAS domain S-box-containing protein
LEQQIVERLSVEESLRESEGRFRALVENLPVKLFIKDRNSVYVSCNPSYASDHGMSPDAIRGKTDFDLYPKELAEKYCEDDRRVMASGQGKEMEESYIAEGRHKWVQTTKIPLKDKQQQVTGILGVFWDITERKRAEEEREKLQKQLIQAQKMESVGRLAGGVAHDFNNMLQAILFNTSMVLEELPPGSSLHECLTEIRNCGERSANLTRQLLAFARRQTIAPKVLDINEIVEGLLKMMRRLIGEDIDLAWRPGAGLGRIKIDPTQIDQILANLCVNARDSINGIGRIAIETDDAVFDEAYCADHPGFMPGEYVRLSVSDTGCGMDKETLERIFEPFFTTKELGKGTGLGLATIYGIVKQNNGIINVYSEPGKGATFNIFLPRVEDSTNPIRIESDKAHPKSCGETVLLVEDEPSILAITSRILGKLGYNVLHANSPVEALRQEKLHNGRIHLLITDVVMPEMSGRELARELLPRQPKLKCLFMSGYTADIIANHGVLDEGVQFIQKPFSIGDLAAKVRESLDATSTH